MRRFTKKLWAALLLLLVSMQSVATDVFTSNRTDFRDESIYFMITTRFYDGDPKNNVLCWDNQAAQIETKAAAAFRWQNMPWVIFRHSGSFRR